MPPPAHKNNKAAFTNCTGRQINHLPVVFTYTITTQILKVLLHLCIVCRIAIGYVLFHTAFCYGYG
jgi:hypothetical protein